MTTSVWWFDTWLVESHDPAWPQGCAGNVPGRLERCCHILPCCERRSAWQGIFSHDIPQYDAKIRQDPPIVEYTKLSAILTLKCGLPAPPKTPNGNNSLLNGDPWIFKEQCAITVAATKDGMIPVHSEEVDEIYLNGTYDAQAWTLVPWTQGSRLGPDEEGKIITLIPANRPWMGETNALWIRLVWTLKTWENKAMDEAEAQELYQVKYARIKANSFRN